MAKLIKKTMRTALAAKKVQKLRIALHPAFRQTDVNGSGFFFNVNMFFVYQIHF
jgi:hypothetical protein